MTEGMPRFHVHFEAECEFSTERSAFAIDSEVLGTREALRAFRAAAHVDPLEADYAFILGCGLRDAGRHEEALYAFQEAVRLQSDASLYRHMLGELLWVMGRHDEAVDTFRAALLADKNDLTAIRGLGAALLAAGHDSEALAILEGALEKDPRRIDVQNNMGVALWRLGETDRALKLFRLASQPDGAAAYVHGNLGIALVARGNHKGALRSFERAYELEPHDSEILADIGDCLFALGRDEEAGAYYQKVRERAPACLEARAVSREANARLVAQAHRARLPVRRDRFSRLLSVALLPFMGLSGGLKRMWRALGRWGSVCMLGLAACMACCGWLIVPPIVQRFLLADDIAAAASAHVISEARVRDRVRHAIRRRGVASYLRAEDCPITTLPGWRRIECRYAVPIEILPGLGFALSFEIDVERPYLEPQETIIF
jgi:tetratricopeptide (TPR) repeat protein